MKCLLFLFAFYSAAFFGEDKISDTIAQYSYLIHQKQLMSKQKKELREEILSNMSGEALETADFKVTRKKTLSIHTSLEEARKLNATKMVEQVDKEKIKQLYLSGVPVQGVELRSNLSVKSKKKILFK